tara:strand:+ start:375 stop:656 length:282 start_codon:yes stop_codon:yes gene_type:complete
MVSGTLEETIKECAEYWFKHNFSFDEKIKELKELKDGESVVDKVTEEMAVWFANDIEDLLYDYWSENRGEIRNVFFDYLDAAKKQEKEDKQYE